MVETKEPTERERELQRLAAIYKNFNDMFPSLDSVWHALLSLALAHALIFCRRCRSTNFERVFGTRNGDCLECGLHQSLTARTFLSNVRVPRAWLFAQWLSSQGHVCTYNLFHDVVKISGSSVAHIFKSLGLAVDSVSNESVIEVESVLFSEIICHRSCETPKRKHPKEEEDYCGKDEFGTSGLSNLSGEKNTQDHVTETSSSDRWNGDAEVFALKSLLGQLSESEQKIVSLISTRPIHMDRLTVESNMTFPVVASSVTMLELGGLILRLPGDYYVLDQRAIAEGRDQGSWQSKKPTAVQMRGIKRFCDIAKAKFSGFSRKDLQLHLNNYRMAVDRKTWTFEAISLTCFRAGYLGSRLIKQHVTQLLVRFPCGADLVGIP